jgi:Asp-tRNA(Asn)/Glu-tRNA(Gln) amidotransferase A subunit family amidase
MNISKTVLLLSALLFLYCESKTESEIITINHIKSAERVIGLEFNPTERDSLLDGVRDNLANYQALREWSLDNSVVPALQFNPIPVGARYDSIQSPLEFSPMQPVQRPADLEDIAFWSVRQLGELIRTRQVTSLELTTLYLERLKRYGSSLECVVTLTEELALEQARNADEEIAAGTYRGPLHGIPYGAKDLLTKKNYKTTWGAMPYKDQVIDSDAAVIKKLEDAGTVLVAKLTMGALAWGDVWFDGKTRNPWNLEEGSSGSSAGPGSATAAGLVGFSIGTETWGSIVSPSTRNGVTGLRPTYGRVSRTGAMALSWSMDKIGPMGRTVEDCALVFNAIYGPDGIDQTLVDLPFNYDHAVDFSNLAIGYLDAAFNEDYPNKEQDSLTLEILRTLGANLVPITLPEYLVENLAFILSAEAAAAFDDLTRSGDDDLLVRQIKNAWPNEFRMSRFIPAVEYIQANRVRYQLIQGMEAFMQTVDLYIAPSFGGDNLLRTNLTGHPCVVLPNGFNEEGSPVSISFIGRLFDEGTILAVANAYQRATAWHLQHPDLDANIAAFETSKIKGGSEEQ